MAAPQGVLSKAALNLVFPNFYPWISSSFNRLVQRFVKFCGQILLEFCCFEDNFVLRNDQYLALTTSTVLRVLRNSDAILQYGVKPRKIQLNCGYLDLI